MKWPKINRDALAELFPFVFILVLTTTMLYPVALGDRPVSLDHTVHYYKAWQLKERLAHGLSAYGWTHDWFAGYPIHYHYPVGAYFAVVGLYVLFFGLLDFSQAYAVTIWGVYLFYGYALYLYGKRVGGRHVGVIGAFLLLTDSGAAFTGGWEWIVHVGAWPIAFSMALALIATVYLDRIAEDRSWRDVGKFALFAGLALNFHPIQLVYLPSMILLLLIAGALRPGPRPFNRATLLRPGTGVGIALFIGSFWLLPLFSSARFALPLGFGYLTLHEIGQQIASGTLFEGMWSYAQVLGLLGSLCLLFHPRPLAFFTALFSFACLLFATHAWSLGERPCAMRKKRLSAAKVAFAQTAKSRRSARNGRCDSNSLDRKTCSTRNPLSAGSPIGTSNKTTTAMRITPRGHGRREIPSRNTCRPRTTNHPAATNQKGFRIMINRKNSK